MENYDLQHIQQLIRQHNKHTAPQRQSLRQRLLLDKRMGILAVIIASGLGLLYYLLYPSAGGLGQYVVLLIFVGFAYFVGWGGDTHKQIWQEHYQEYPQPYAILFNHFFENLKVVKNQDVVKQRFAGNRFLLRYGSVDLEKLHVWSGMISYKTANFLQYKTDFSLLQLQADHQLTEPLHIRQQSDLKSPIEPKQEQQQYGYFPELEAKFDFYTEQKAKIAEWIQKNEPVLLELLNFEKFYLEIVFLPNEINCLVAGLDKRLIGQLDEYIELDEQAVADLYQQLQDLRRLVDILHKLT